MKYSEAKQFNPSMTECFFAFSNQQFEEGKAKNIPEGKKVLSGPFGLFGTQEGINDFIQQYNEHDKMIVANCDPQDVYNYEFGNHECGYTGDDTEAMDIVKGFFPDAEIKRFPAELMEEY